MFEIINLETLLFYIFTSLLISSSFLVILSKNPVHSVLFLILSFFNTTLLLMLCQVEFIAIILIMIYVGAIAILFLFVVMMLDIKIIDQKIQEKSIYIPVSFFIFTVFIMEVLTFNNITSKDLTLSSIPLYFNWISNYDFVSNTETIGQLLYTYYFIYFLIAGIILLIALVGAVSLTLKKSKSLNQQVYKQISRKINNSIFNYK